MFGDLFCILFMVLYSIFICFGVRFRMSLLVFLNRVGGFLKLGILFTGIGGFWFLVFMLRIVLMSLFFLLEMFEFVFVVWGGIVDFRVWRLLVLEYICCGILLLFLDLINFKFVFVKWGIIIFLGLGRGIIILLSGIDFLFIFVVFRRFFNFVLRK